MERWIMPCNLKFFDIAEHLKENNLVVWKKPQGLKEGDVVYSYVGVPVQKVKYRFLVKAIDIPEDIISKHPYAKKDDIEHTRNYMLLAHDHTYEEGISLEQMKALGLFMVRKQTRLAWKISEYMHDFDKQN
jgi:hypothetical protein